MTESAPPQSGATPPGGEVPVPAGTPEQPVVKGGGGRRIIAIIVAVAVLGALGIYRFVLPAIEDSKWKVGACVDYWPAGMVEFDIKPKIVDCSDDAAKARIVGVFGSDSTIERDCEPLDSFAQISRSNGKKYCIVQL